MTELFTLSGYIFAIIIAILYEYQRISQLRSSKNNVRFYVARDKNGELWLYMGKPIRVVNSFFACSNGMTLLVSESFSKYGINKDNYDNLKWEDEPVEIFLNLED